MTLALHLENHICISRLSLDLSEVVVDSPELEFQAVKRRGPESSQHLNCLADLNSLALWLWVLGSFDLGH